MIDANNGYNYNLARHVLSETADLTVHWIEEPFHEDGQLYRRLRTWLAAEGLETQIADGEGEASRRLLDWAREGLVDVIQHDVRHPGFSHWLALGPQLDEWGVCSAPHNYGGALGNYCACHLAARIARFAFAEWDEIAVGGLDASAYRIVDGLALVPELPGFGVELDDGTYSAAVRDHGFVVTAH
jgi:L-alanine-DL-glutamate epimerase-like enolase superfamily enzyme